MQFGDRVMKYLGINSLINNHKIGYTGNNGITDAE